MKAFKEFTFHEWDITKSGIFKSLSNRKFDVIFNFACPASPPKYQSMPIHTTMTCTVGTKNVLDLARVCGSTVVHASTSEVYGEPLSSPQIESEWSHVNTYGKRSCYDCGKSAAEGLCYDYRNFHGVDVKVVRIFNTFGEHMDPNDGRVVSNFVCQALTNSDLTIYGTGSQTRSLCYVSDLIEGIVKLSCAPREFSGPVNVGNPEEVTILKIAQTVLELIPDSASKIVYREIPQDDPKRRCPDIGLAVEKLSWSPKVSMREGLTRVIPYFREALRDDLKT